MDSETVVESLYELKTRGRHALDAIQLLRDELLHSQGANSPEQQGLAASLDELEFNLRGSSAASSFTLLFNRLLEDDDVGRRWSLLVADKLSGLR